MKRVLAFVLAIFLLAGTASAAKFYWKTSLADLNAVSGKADGDRGIVIDFSGAVTFYYHAGGSWIPGTVYANTWTSITGTPTTIAGYGITDNILMQNGSAAGLTSFPTLNQSTTGNAGSATVASTLFGQYIDWSQSTGGTSIANRPTINGSVLAGAALDNVLNYPGLISDATAGGFLIKTGTAGATLGLDNTCSLNQIPKWNGSAWVCAADASGGAGGNPSFDNVQSGTNTSAAMVVGTGSSLAASGSGTITATALSAQYVDWAQTSGATSVANRPTINSVAVAGTVLDNVSNYPAGLLRTTGSAASLTSVTASALAFGSDARGDIAVRGASAYGRLGIGASGKVLTTNGTDPAWSAYTIAAPGASGAVLASDGTNWTRNSAISAASLTGQYIDWAAGSGGTSIANKPTLGTLSTKAAGTMTDTKYCIYTTSGDQIICNSEGGSGGGGTTTLPWDNVTSRPTINSVTVTGAVLDNVSNYPAGLERTANKSDNTSLGYSTTLYPTQNAVKTYTDTGLAAKAAVGQGMYIGTTSVAINRGSAPLVLTGITSIDGSAAALGAQYINWSSSTGGTSVANRPTIGGTVVTGTVLDNAAKYPTLNQSTTGTAAGLTAQYIDWAAGSGGTSIKNKPTLGGGDFYGPASSTDNAVVIFSGTGGKTGKNSLVTVDNTGKVTAPGGLNTGTGTDGQRRIILGNNTSISPTAAVNEIYFEANVLKVNENGTERTVAKTSGNVDFATTGTITGGIMILDNVVSPTAAQCYGSWNTITTAGTVTLPAAAPGMSTCIATEGALEITLELDGSDTFVLNGVTMDAGEAIINTTAEAAGDYICVIATSAVKWRVAGMKGTWTQATP